MKKHTSQNRFAHPTRWILACLAIIPLFLIALTNFITFQSFSHTAAWFSAHPGPAFFEYLALLFVCIFLYAVTRKLWLSALLPGIVLLLVTLISYYKTVLNGTPLLPADFALAPQFFSVASFALPQLSISLYTVAALIAFALGCAALFIADLHIQKIRGLRPVLAIASVFYVILFLCTPLLRNWAVSMTDETLTPEETVTQYGAGLGLYFASIQKEYSTSAPTKTELNRLQAQVNTLEPTTSEQATGTPTVIFLMSESFFDATKLPGVEFSEDPIPVFHSLAAEQTSGSFISSTYCGGTGYVEMEVLTGICSKLLNESETLTSLSPTDVYTRLPTITDIFKEYGYKTNFLHSYTPNLYNREAIYTQFGFDSVLFDDSFGQDAEIRGGYISDMELSKKIISLYEESDGAPLFLYAVSMENHQPYYAGKFDGTPEVTVQSDLLSSDELALLQSYAEGLHDADRALGTLVDYFSQRPDPVMIVFFGDHLPNLSVNESSNVYTSLGYSSSSVTTTWQADELAKMLSTDYVIWTNYENSVSPDKPESCTLLGLSVLNRLGFQLNDYYGWLNQYVAPEMLIYRPRLYVDAQGTPYADIPEQHTVAMDDYRTAVYDIIYGDQLVFDPNNEGGTQ